MHTTRGYFNVLICFWCFYSDKEKSFAHFQHCIAYMVMQYYFIFNNDNKQKSRKSKVKHERQNFPQCLFLISIKIPCTGETIAFSPDVHTIPKRCQNVYYKWKQDALQMAKQVKFYVKTLADTKLITIKSSWPLYSHTMHKNTMGGYSNVFSHHQLI